MSRNNNTNKNNLTNDASNTAEQNWNRRSINQGYQPQTSEHKPSHPPKGGSSSQNN